MEIIRSAEGGMKTHFVSLLKGLNKEYFNVYALCSFEGTTMADLKKSGIHVDEWPIPGGMHPFHDLKTILHIMNLIRKKDIHVVHVHGFKAGFVGRIAAGLTGRPAVYTVHNSMSAACQQAYQKWLIHAVERLLLPKTQRMIAVSKALEKEMKALSNTQNIVTVYNGISISNGFSEAEKDPQAPFVVGTAARLIPSKGIKILIDGVNLVHQQKQNIRLEIYGDGPQRRELEEYIAYKGMDGFIRFHGFSSELDAVYPSMDLFVLPSLHEGLGIALLEAMAYGVPVIGSKVGGIPEIIQAGYNGELVNPGDPEELARKIIDLSEDEARRKLYRNNGKKYIEDHFRRQDMIERIERILWDAAL